MARFDADSEISLVTPRVGSQNISQFQPGAPTQPVSPPSSRSVGFKNFNNSVLQPSGFKLTKFLLSIRAIDINLSEEYKFLK